MACNRTTPAQATADSMGKFVARADAKFCLALGDNFYGGHGVANEYDELFKGTFEDVFVAPSLQYPFRFHLIAGNVDHYGNLTGQTEYSMHSKRWHF
jgi:tartrate-resistant acid phosphatase type 5